MKRNIIIFVCLLALGIGFLYFKKNNLDQKYSQVQPYLSLQEKDMSRVTIIQRGDTVNLYLKDGVWTVGEQGIVANKNRVKNLLKRLFKLDAKEIVSNKISSLQKYALDSLQRKEIKIYNNVSVLVLHAFIGRFSSLVLNGSYWKKFANSEIYRCCGNITYDVISFPLTWKNLKAHFFPTEKLTKINVYWSDKNKKNKNRFLFKKQKWTLNKKKVDSTKVQSMVQKLVAFQADDIVEIEKKDKKNFKIELVLESGKEETYQGFLDKKNVYIPYNKGSDELWFQISRDLFESLFQSAKEFQKK